MRKRLKTFVKVYMDTTVNDKKYLTKIIWLASKLLRNKFSSSDVWIDCLRFENAGVDPKKAFVDVYKIVRRYEDKYSKMNIRLRAKLVDGQGREEWVYFPFKNGETMEYNRLYSRIKVDGGKVWGENLFYAGTKPDRDFELLPGLPSRPSKFNELVRWWNSASETERKTLVAIANRNEDLFNDYDEEKSCYPYYDVDTQYYKLFDISASCSDRELGNYLKERDLEDYSYANIPLSLIDFFDPIAYAKHCQRERLVFKSSVYDRWCWRDPEYW